MKKKRLMSMVATISLMATMLAGCGTDSAENADGAKQTANTAEIVTENAGDGEPKYGGVLKYASHSTVSTPGYTPECTNNASLPYLTVAYESLTTYDEKGNIAPKLATEWKTNADEASITWTLRENVKFADGTDFNADAVKRNIEEYQKCQRNETANIESCEVIDDMHIKMKLKSWNSSTLESIGFFVYYMSPKALEDIESLRNSSCGTGPFQVSEFNSGVSVKYVKNENYWQEGKPYLDGVEMYIVDEPTTRASAFEAGEYDIILMNNLTVASDLMNKGKYVVEKNVSGQGLIMTGLIPNSADENSPFADEKVRRAMCYALDTKALCDAFGYGLLTTTDEWASPNAVTYNNEIVTMEYNPEKAKELLASAGYADGFSTTLTTDAGNKDIFTAAANMLDEVGIHCEINLVDESAQVSLYSTGTWDGIMGHFASIAPDLGLYMGRHLDEDGAFYAAGIQHPKEAMDLLEAIRVAPTEEEKVELEHEMQKLMYDGEMGLAIFGKPIFIQNEPVFKYDYVIDDDRSVYHVGTWNLENCWLNR